MTSIGIIGAGMIANVHAEAASAVGTKVTAVCDPRKENAYAFGETHSCAVEENADIQNNYSIQFIHYMTQCFKISPNVNIHVSPHIPIQIKYLFDNNNETTNNYIRLFLAPKIND